MRVKIFRIRALAVGALELEGVLDLFLVFRDFQVELWLKGFKAPELFIGSWRKADHGV